MFNPSYLIPRLARHFMPSGATRFLLRRGWMIRPGLETRDPDAAARRSSARNSRRSSAGSMASGSTPMAR